MCGDEPKKRRRRQIGKPQYGLLATEAMPSADDTTQAGIARRLEMVNARGNGKFVDAAGKAGIMRPQFDPKTAPMMAMATR